MSEQKQGVNWRAWTVGVLAALVLIVALQNSQQVEVEVLFVETKAPLIITLLIAVGIGAVIGYVTPLVRRHRRQGRESREG
ncbi:MAG: LapA family protein [Solirubrobacterales bacterium]